MRTVAFLHEVESSCADGLERLPHRWPSPVRTDHGYTAYRIPVDDDHIPMTPGKTDYLCDSLGARIPAWRITLSLVQRPIVAAFDAGRETVSAELDAMEQSDRQGLAA